MSEKPFLLSSIGKKYLMGVTGLVWAGFILGHMLGNLLMFISSDAYNSYGHALTSGNVIYAIEAVLITCLIVHVTCAISLTIENRKARGSVRYAASPSGEKAPSIASKTMAIQGSIILMFIILHLITFKFGEIYMTQVNGVEMRDLYRLVIEVFNQPIYLAWYFLSLVILFFHLSHGFGSIFQSFGIRPDKYGGAIKKLSWTYAVVVAGGFISQPLYVLFLH